MYIHSTREYTSRQSRPAQDHNHSAITTVAEIPSNRNNST